MIVNPSAQPTRPTHIPAYAEVCLNALAERQLGDKISLGGAFALLHYLDYRSTYDVDAWWQLDISEQERQQLISVIESALQNYGQVRIRTWGEVVSIELDTDDKKKAFSFQIAARSAQLYPSVPAHWINVLLDSFPDLTASKMTALVERGAPRDFRDIYTICQAGLATPVQCWQLWRQRQQQMGSDIDLARARLAIETHLARIVRQRPLSHIPNLQERAQAEHVRNWYKQDFLNVSMD